MNTAKTSDEKFTNIFNVIESIKDAGVKSFATEAIEDRIREADEYLASLIRRDFDTSHEIESRRIIKRAEYLAINHPFLHELIREMKEDLR